MNLPSPKTTKKSKQVGRGVGSTKGGHTTGRGMKGQRSRSGYRKPGPNFEGGQNPLSRRLPKVRGYSGNKSRKRGYKTSKQRPNPIQLSELEAAFDAGETVSYKSLVDKKVVIRIARIIDERDYKKGRKIEKD